MKSKRNIILIIIVISALMLTGCAEVTLTGSIDVNYNTSYTIDANIDVSKMKAQEIESIVASLNDLVVYYKEHGYDASVTQDGLDMHFQAVKGVRCGSYKECFETLNSYMTSDTSPLKEYSYELNSHHFFDEYIINGSIDTSNLISSEGYTGLPNEIKDEVDKKLTQCDFRLILSLPNQIDLSDNSKSNQITTIQVPVNKLTTFNVEGRVNNEENLAGTKKYAEEVNYYKNLIIVFGVIIAVLIGIIIFALIRLKGPKKKNK